MSGLDGDEICDISGHPYYHGLINYLTETSELNAGARVINKQAHRFGAAVLCPWLACDPDISICWESK
jgi:hypothetical protein